MKKIPAIFSWSGGKDSSYALYKVMQEGVYEVRYLLSTINGNFRRLSMHGVREELIEAQSASIGIPLKKVYVYESDNASYERQMAALLEQVKLEGIEHVIFGDIFLEDLRAYREEKMKQVGMHCKFPLWKLDTALLIKDFVDKGFRTMTCCINDGYLDESWCGRLVDEEFIRSLPSTVDSCGEHGEFHTYCFEGPIFRFPLPIHKGELTYRELEIKTNNHPTPIKDVGTKGFWFCDLTIE